VAFGMACERPPGLLQLSQELTADRDVEPAQVGGEGDDLVA
jgi:hypothetical protein